MESMGPSTSTRRGSRPRKWSDRLMGLGGGVAGFQPDNLALAQRDPDPRARAPGRT